MASDPSNPQSMVWCDGKEIRQRHGLRMETDSDQPDSDEPDSDEPQNMEWWAGKPVQSDSANAEADLDEPQIRHQWFNQPIDLISESDKDKDVSLQHEDQSVDLNQSDQNINNENNNNDLENSDKDQDISLEHEDQSENDLNASDNDWNVSENDNNDALWNEVEDRNKDEKDNDSANALDNEIDNNARIKKLEKESTESKEESIIMNELWSVKQEELESAKRAIYIKHGKTTVWNTRLDFDLRDAGVDRFIIWKHFPKYRVEYLINLKENKMYKLTCDGIEAIPYKFLKTWNENSWFVTRLY